MGIQTSKSDFPRHFGFLLLPGFPLAAMASAVDVLALTNYVSEQPLYRWSMLSAGPQHPISMNGMRCVIDSEMETAPTLDAIVVCSGVGGSQQDAIIVQNWLRERYASGSHVGAISTGSWLLARAGLLHGKRCTVHWEDMKPFQETFPDLEVTSEIFEVDGRTFTCSGGSSAMDMFLSFVAAQYGASLAASVSDQLVHGPARSDDTGQRPGMGPHAGITSQPVTEAIQIMEVNIETPMPMCDIADRLGISTRNLERLFRRHLQSTPQLYYRRIRLQEAQSMLRSTTMRIAEVAFACGFNSSSYFSKCYSAQFGRLPASERTLQPQRSAKPTDQKDRTG